MASSTADVWLLRKIYRPSKIRPVYSSDRFNEWLGDYDQSPATARTLKKNTIKLLRKQIAFAGSLEE